MLLGWRRFNLRTRVRQCVEAIITSSARQRLNQRMIAFATRSFAVINRLFCVVLRFGPGLGFKNERSTIIALRSRWVARFISVAGRRRD